MSRPLEKELIYIPLIYEIIWAIFLTLSNTYACSSVQEIIKYRGLFFFPFSSIKLSNCILIVLRGYSLDLRHKATSVLFQFICTFNSLKLVCFTTILNAVCVSFSRASLMFQLWRSSFSTCIALCFFSTKFPFPKGYMHECVYFFFLYVFIHMNLCIYTYIQIYHLDWMIIFTAPLNFWDIQNLNKHS